MTRRDHGRARRSRRSRRRASAATEPARLEPELRQVADAFGVAAEQVRRDHLISHILGAIGTDLAARVVFFGGTTLSRTLFPDGRLSEDVDLLALGDRGEVAQRLERSAPERLARSHGVLTWDPSPTQARGSTSAVLHTDDGLSVRIQLLVAASYPP